jgi:hypothetical protein
MKLIIANCKINSLQLRSLGALWNVGCVSLYFLGGSFVIFVFHTVLHIREGSQGITSVQRRLFKRDTKFTWHGCLTVPWYSSEVLCMLITLRRWTSPKTHYTWIRRRRLIPWLVWDLVLLIMQIKLRLVTWVYSLKLSRFQETTNSSIKWRHLVILLGSLIVKPRDEASLKQISKLIAV